MRLPAAIRNEWLLVSVLVLPVTCFVSRSQLQQQPDGSQVYQLTIQTPNVTLVNDDVFVCVSAHLNEPGYIVAITPKPITGMYYHMTVVVCDDPGYKGAIGKAGVWECGRDYYGNPNPPLPSASRCVVHGEHSYGLFGYQFQGGPADEGALCLPPHTGIPVGGEEGRRYIVAGFHFPQKNRTMNGTTGVSEIGVTIKHTTEKMEAMNNLIFGGNGFVGPNSLGSVAGTWTLKQDISIKIWLMYAHFHAMAIDFKVWIGTSEASDLVLHQKPTIFRGITLLDPNKKSTMHAGDKVIVECLFNNTMSRNLRIWDTDMCRLIMFYSSKSRDKSLDVTTLDSYDAFYESCFRHIGLISPSRTEEINFEGNSSYRGQVTAVDCMP